MSNTWEKLSQINVNEHVKSKGGLSYLSWAWAWGVAKKACPDATYKVINFDGKPYHWDEHLGYMVQTEVTIDSETIPMHLFVMDHANKAQKHVDYKYKPRSGTEKTCVAATMFDVNTAIMRCLTKNLAMFGLGHYIYAGEDLPEPPPEPSLNTKQEKEIHRLLDIKEVDTINFFKAFHITKISDFSHKNAQIAISKLTAKPDKETE
ncbi:DUF1071 domain-containing protein [Candidatus Pacearchaeota archaeon]|nr:DUF1071 domain-containing protein [Candidatus Pacearchaeota archaeon]